MGFSKCLKTTPFDLLSGYPFAYLQYIILLLVRGNSADARDGRKRLNELQETYEKNESIRVDLKNRILAEINVTRIFCVFNDAEKLIECSNEALRLLDGAKSCIMKKKSEFTFGCPHFLYTYFKKQGKLKETVDIMVNGFPVFSRIADGCGAGCEYVAMAEYALETGDWRAAELNAFKAIYRTKAEEQTGLRICATFTLIRLNIMRGKADEGPELLRQLRNDINAENNPIYNTTMDLCEGYVYGCLGQMENIPLWLQSGDMSLARFLFQGIAFNYIVYGKTVLAAGKYLELEMLTETLAQAFPYSATNWALSIIKSLTRRRNAASMVSRKAVRPCKRLLIWEGMITSF